MLLFLLLTISYPTVLLGGPVTFIQKGSADVSSFAPRFFGVPVFRNEVYITLPGLSIEIAIGCGGIHSILTLFIISLIAGHLTGLTGWKRLVLVMRTFPVVCLTNELRISAITLLTAYMDPRIICSSLHRDGGFLFFGLALVFSACVLYLMGVRQKRAVQAAPPASLPVGNKYTSGSRFNPPNFCPPFRKLSDQFFAQFTPS